MGKDKMQFSRKLIKNFYALSVLFNHCRLWYLQWQAGSYIKRFLTKKCRGSVARFVNIREYKITYSTLFKIPALKSGSYSCCNDIEKRKCNKDCIGSHIAL